MLTLVIHLPLFFTLSTWTGKSVASSPLSADLRQGKWGKCPRHWTHMTYGTIREMYWGSQCNWKQYFWFFLEVLFKTMAKPQNAFPVVPGVVQGSIPLGKYGVGITDLCLGSSKGRSITAPPSLAVTCWKLPPETKQCDLGYIYSEVSTMLHDTHNCNPGRSSDLG